MPKLDIVVVNWNTGSYLRDCLAALSAASRSAFDLGLVVVVDNDSEDDSLTELPDFALPLRIHRNRENRGFAAASNQGAAEGDGDYILFLNPDTRVSIEALDRTIMFMSDPAHSDIGICGGRMIGVTGVQEFSCARFPTLLMVTAKMMGLARVLAPWIPKQRIEAEELVESGVVDQVIGAYFVIRRQLFERLLGFDERFFVYMEDVDLAYRSRLSGSASYFLSDVIVHHIGNVSSDQVRGKRLFYSLRARTEYARKHWRPWQAVVLEMLTLGVEVPARFALAAGRRQRTEVKDVGEAASRYVRYLVASRTEADAARR